MARRQARPAAAAQLSPRARTSAAAPTAAARAQVAYHSRRTVATLDGLYAPDPGGAPVPRAGLPAAITGAYRPEEEGRWALPQGEFGLDVIALVGALRFAEHRSVPEIHQALRGAGRRHRRAHGDQPAAPLRGAGRAAAGRPARGCASALAGQGQVILALDGLQPDVGHEVLWVLRDCLSGEVLLARSLLGSDRGRAGAAAARGRAPRCRCRSAGVISDGQESIRNAVRRALPGVPHQLCQFHYLREAAKPIFEADRHAKKELKKEVRGVRPIERALEGRDGRRGGRGPRLLPGGPQRADRRRPPAAVRLGAEAARPARRRSTPPSAGWRKRGAPAGARPPPAAPRPGPRRDRRPLAGPPHRLLVGRLA